MTFISILVGTLVAGMGSVWLAALLAYALLSRFTQHLLSLAAGALLATAFTRLLPEAFEQAMQAGVSAQALFASLLVGLVFFFLLDKAELWHHGHEHGHGHHAHEHEHEHAHEAHNHHSGGWAVLLGDSVHAFGDGILIAAAFVADPRLGVAAALAVMAHEVPHHVGDLVVLRQTLHNPRAALFKLSLAGGVTTVAFTAVLRVRAVVDAAGAGEVASRTLLVIGLFSILVAALFLLSARDFKRMLAYSSVEHMGILSFGAALGGVGLWAAFFHVWNNSMTKGALFLSAGYIGRAAGGRTIDEVSGMSVIAPRSSALFVAGLFAVTACPPFGPFFSELLIVKSAFATEHGWAAAFFLVCLLLAFFGLTRVVFAIVYGRPRNAARTMDPRFRETLAVIVPPVVLLLLSLWLGLATPEVLREAWTAAVSQLAPKP